MPNQYNAADLSNVPSKSRSLNYGDGYPIPSASGIGGANAISVTTGLFGGQKGTDAFIEENSAIDAAPKLNTRPNLGQDGGFDGTEVTGGFNAGTGSDKVIDHIDAPHNLNTDPYLDSDV